MILMRLALLITTISCMPFIHSLGTFSNNGNFQSRNINIHAANIIAGGKFIGSESVHFTCSEAFSGNGIVQSPEVTIKVKKFNFTGTIHCENICRIITEEPFNRSQFKKAGNGKFIIEVVRNNNANNAAQ